MDKDSIRLPSKATTRSSKESVSSSASSSTTPQQTNTNTKKHFSLKSYVVLAALMLLVFSQTFMEQVLSPVCSICMDGKDLNFKGAVVSVIVVIILHAIIMHYL